MVELTTRQEAKVITFANKAYQAIGDLADKARLENDRKEVKKIVTSGMKLGIFLISLDDKRTNWSTLFTLRTIDRYIDEFDLFKIPFNPTQLSFDNITTRILGDTGDGTGDFATTLQLNAEAAARVNQDDNLQNQITALDNKVDNLDFSTLVPETVVFSEATPGYKDFPTELGINLPNKAVLDSISQQDVDDIGLNTTHRNNADIHVTAAQKLDWDTRVTPAELSSGLSGKAALNHTHTIGQIQSLQSELDQLAQDIIDNAAEDGVTPSISIGNVVSGTVPSVSLGSASTPENPILDFVLVPGEQGEQGEPFQFDAIDFLANRSNYISEPFGFSFVDVQTGLVYYKQAGAGQDEWSGGIRTIGDRGWTPVHVLEPIDGKAYLKLVDYVDGQGVKPTQNIGAYVGPTGYVVSPLAATNLKGNKGDSPVQGIDYEIPRFKIDTTLTYSQYLSQSSILLANQAIGYTIQFDGSSSPYENKDGMIAILSRNASTGAREWREYEFQGEQGPAGVPGPKGDPGDVPEAPIDGLIYGRQDGVWVDVGDSVTIEQTRSQSTTAVPSSKLLDDELNSISINPTVDATYTNLGATPSFDLDTADVFKRTVNENVTNLSFTGGIEGKVYQLKIKVSANSGFDFEYDHTIIETQDGIELILPSDVDYDVIHLFQIQLQDNGNYFVSPVYDIQRVRREYETIGTSETITITSNDGTSSNPV